LPGGALSLPFAASAYAALRYSGRSRSYRTFPALPVIDWNWRVMMTMLAAVITVILMVLLNTGSAKHRAQKSRKPAFSDLDGAAEGGTLAEGRTERA
jgi:hypothetical protein